MSITKRLTLTQPTHINSVLDIIGNTPLIKLSNIAKDIDCSFFCKAEFFNPGHSTKDRIAVMMIEKAERDGLLNPGGTIIEATSGNTGFSLAMVAANKGYKCIFAVTGKISEEKKSLLRAMGAEVVVCPANVKPDDPLSYYSQARRLSEEIPNSYYVNQYFNLANSEAHYLTTGPEIWKQTNGKLTHYVAAAGTGGTLSGTARYLKVQNPNIKVIGIDAYGSILKKYHETGIFDEKEIFPYTMEGVGKNMIPDNVDFDVIDQFVKVSDKDAALTARVISKKEGLFVGHSSGAAMWGAMSLRNTFKPKDCVVVMFPDHGSRYLGKIYSDDWMKSQGFM
ncbi:MAG: cysteine synthase family protein [Saprospiraceae bacterium]|nr:cysteine synthase family protein [Saprospiraceae bacterium]